VRFVLGHLEREADGTRVVTTVDENVEDGLFPRSVGDAQVPLGLYPVLNRRSPRADGIAYLLFTVTRPTCRTAGACAAGAARSLSVPRRFDRNERVTVVCSDRVTRSSLATPKLRLTDVEYGKGTAPFFVYALPCAAVAVLLGDTPEIADGPLKPLDRNVELPAAPPWRGCVSGARDEGYRGCRLLWSGDLNRDGVVDVIIRRVGEMGCGEHQLWLSIPGGGWRVAAANEWYC
jgi:hypothetical protein